MTYLQIYDYKILPKGLFIRKKILVLVEKQKQ